MSVEHRSVAVTDLSITEHKPADAGAARGDGGCLERPIARRDFLRAGTMIVAAAATRSLDRLPIRREGDQLVVDVDTVYRQDRDRSQWRAAVVQR